MSFGGGLPPAGPGGVYSYQGEQWDGDPRVSPGLPRPVGWRVRSPDGTQAYDKFGTGDTQWVPVGSGSGGLGVTSFQGATNSGLTPATATTGTVSANQFMVAAWPLGAANRRVFLVDGVNGSDTNPGYLDAPVAFPLSGPTIAATAKKTLASLASVFPQNLSGRTFELIIASGTYTDALQTFMGSLVGVPSGCVIRGTVTNATANSTAFAGNIADATMAGFVTAAGMNAAGYNPTGTPTTQVIQCLKVGGGAAGFGAEPARPDGVRIRFDAATSTVALRNACAFVAMTNGSDTITLPVALPAVPTASDVFYVEEGGVIVPSSTVSNSSMVGSELQLAGLRCSGTLLFLGGAWTCAGVVANVLNATEVANLSASTTYTHPTLGTITDGGGARADTTSTFRQCTQLAINFFCSAGFCQFSDHLNNFNPFTQQAALFGAGLKLTGLAGQNAVAVSLGSTVPVTPGPRSIATGPEGCLHLADSRCQVAQLQLTGAGAQPALRLENQCFLFISPPITGSPGVQLSGAIGNNDVGLDLTLARNSRVLLSPRTPIPTLTGALGDVRLAGNLIISWAALVAGLGIRDVAGNQIIVGDSTGTSTDFTHFSVAPLSTVAKFSGTVVASEGAVFSYLADTGSEIVGAPNNQVDPIQYPSSQRIISRLRLVSPGGTPSVPPTATLYKNGIATAMTVTLPASTGGVVEGSDLAHPILFAAGDTYDVRIDYPGVIPGNQAVSACLEGP